ncbi:MAG TPA: carboxypeptidase-like regulatory domain-containing protein [Vicinamibacterales bacterium]
MASKYTVTSAAVIGLLVLTAVVCPATQASREQAPAAKAAATTVTATHSTSVVGSAWNADNSGIPGARLRMRDVSTNKIVAAAVADQLGQFRFDNVAPGSYLIELVEESGKLVAVGQVFTIATGETVATFVRLGTRVPWFAGFFSNAAASAIAAAASEGVTALAPVARPVSRKQ